MDRLENLKVTEFLDLVEKGESEVLSELIIRHRDRWNRLVEEALRLKKILRLRGLELYNQDLSGINLASAIIEDSDFSGSDLTGSRLEDASAMRTGPGRNFQAQG